MIHVMGARYRYVRCDDGIPLSRNPCRDMQHSLQVRMDESLNVHVSCTSSALILRLMRPHSSPKPCRCTPYTRTRKPSVSHSIKMNLDEIALASYSCDTLTPLLYALSSRRSARIVSRMRDIGVGLRVNAREVAGRPLSIPLKRATPPLVYKCCRQGS